MGFAQGDLYGGSIPPSTIGYYQGEYTGAVPSSIRRRQYLQQYHPTVMASMGMHALPPVSVRVPISDQYAAGIARPDLSLNTPDPTVFHNINGNIGLGSSVNARAQGLATLRQRIDQQRQARNSIVDTQL